MTPINNLHRFIAVFLSFVFISVQFPLPYLSKVKPSHTCYCCVGKSSHCHCQHKSHRHLVLKCSIDKLGCMHVDKTVEFGLKEGMVYEKLVLNRLPLLERILLISSLQNPDPPVVEIFHPPEA